MRRLIKFLFCVVVLVLIAFTGLVVMVTSVEDPLAFYIQRPQAGPGAGATLECEVRNMSPFPMDVLPGSLTLLPADKPTEAFIAVAEPGAATPAPVHLKPGETWQTKLQSPAPVNPKDTHTFSYEWYMWGQQHVKDAHAWLETNATFIPASWRARAFFLTEPRKGRVKNVPVPGSSVAAMSTAGSGGGGGSAGAGAATSLEEP